VIYVDVGVAKGDKKVAAAAPASVTRRHVNFAKVYSKLVEKLKL